MYKHNNKTVWRCVDWDNEKGQERFEKGKNRHDPYIVSMTTGTKGIYMGSENLNLDDDDRPCIFRGLGKSPLIHKCIEKGIDYMYIDTGYFGNGKKKHYHRIAFNNLQTLNHRSIDSVKKLLTSGIGEREARSYFKRADDIFNSGQAFENWYRKGDIQYLDTVPLESVERGKTILVVPPSQKVFNHFGGEAIEWTNKLIENIKKVTDRPIEIREHMFYLSCCQFTGEQMQSIITKRTIEVLQGDQTPRGLTI